MCPAPRLFRYGGQLEIMYRLPREQQIPYADNWFSIAIYQSFLAVSSKTVYYFYKNQRNVI